MEAEARLQIACRPNVQPFISQTSQHVDVAKLRHNEFLAPAACQLTQKDPPKAWRSRALRWRSHVPYGTWRRGWDSNLVLPFRARKLQILCCPDRHSCHGCRRPLHAIARCQRGASATFRFLHLPRVTSALVSSLIVALSQYNLGNGSTSIYLSFRPVAPSLPFDALP